MHRSGFDLRNLREQESELKEGDVVKVHDIWSEAEKSVRAVPEPKKFLVEKIFRAENTDLVLDGYQERPRSGELCIELVEVIEGWKRIIYILEKPRILKLTYNDFTLWWLRNPDAQWPDV